MQRLHRALRSDKYYSFCIKKQMMQSIQQIIPPIINGENLLMHPEINVGIPKNNNSKGKTM